MGPEEYFQKGTALFRERKFDSAASAFLAAVKQRKVFPEAYKGLYLAYKALGDMKKAGHCAQLAAESYILQSKMKEAAGLYLSVRKEHLELENPFKKLAEASLRQGKKNAGAKLLSLASKCQPEDEGLVCKAALALKANDNLEQAVHLLEQALAGAPFPNGAKLYRQLTGHPWETPFPEQKEKTPPAETPENAKQAAQEEASQEDFREKRRAKRYPLLGYYVRVNKGKEEHEVLNLSATGIAFAAQELRFSRGEQIVLDLFGMEGLICKKLDVTVRHVTEGSAGCSFGKLGKKQLAVIEELIGPHNDADEFYVDPDAPIDLTW